MRFCVVLCLLLVSSVCSEPSLRGAGTSSVKFNYRQPRGLASDPPQCSPTTKVSSEPDVLRSLQQQLVDMQKKVDQMSIDMTYTRQKVDQSARHVEQLMRYFIKTSCTEVVTDPMAAPTTSGRPDISRQNSMDGVYAILPPRGSLKRVKCDHISSGDPGWTVVLLRETGSLAFNRSYEEYKTGFGDPSTEVWIGLDTLHALTAVQPHQLRVELRNFAGQFAYAHYNDFSIGAMFTHYKLSIGGYDSKSTAGDALKDHNNMLFSTMDVDQDKEDGSCANQFGGGGGWWYAKCYVALGTGRYRKPSNPGMTQVQPDYGGVTWHPFGDVKMSLQHFKLLIKAKDT